MEMRFFAALALFLGSYFTLAVILTVQDIKESSWRAPVCTFEAFSECSFPELSNPGRVLPVLLVCLASLIVFSIFMWRLSANSSLKVVDAKSIPNDLINYVFPYVVSFMGLDIGGDGKFYGFLIFVGLMFLITYRSGQILMNPLLLMAGWQLYELNIVIEGNRRCVRALSRERVKPGDYLDSCLVQGIFVLHRR